MSTLLENINEELTLVVEIIPIQSSFYETLYYSTRALTITVDGKYKTVYPYITHTLDVTSTCVLPIQKGEVIKRPSIDGFQLMYNIGVTYNVSAYYGATVNCYVGSNRLNRLEDFTRFYKGFVGNVKIDVNNTYVTIDSNIINLQENLLSEYDNKVVPVILGKSERFGAVPVRVGEEIYHVLCGHPATVHNVYNSLGNPIAYHLVPFNDWVVIKCDEPTDGSIIISAENGQGAIGDLLRLLVGSKGVSVEDSDIDLINSLASDYTSIQVFEQVTYEKAITTIVHSLTHVWYFDLVTSKIRFKPFYRSTPTMTISDEFIVRTNNSMAYRKRPYTDFEIVYDINFSNGTYKNYKIEHPLKSEYDPIQYKEYPTVYALTSNDTSAQNYIHKIMNLYGSGLGVLELEMNLYQQLPFVGDNVIINSDFLKLNNKHFFVERVTYKFTTLTVALTLVTI